MNKSVLVGAIFIGVCVVASPFVFDSVKNKQREEKQLRVDVELELVDINGLNKAALLYKKNNGVCPKKASDMIDISIRKEPKDRIGIPYETKGNCEFTSSRGISIKDDIAYQINQDRLKKS